MSDQSEDLDSITNKYLKAGRHIFTKCSSLITGLTLFLLTLIAFGIRVFSIIKYESIIHEFDPWFNYRATKFLETHGRKEFAFWFDTKSWYPLGRYVGQTVFPGLMYTTVFIKKILHALLIPVSTKDVCVFTAPAFASLTTIAVFLLAREISGKTQTGLLAALFISVNASYLTRSVAGSYDNEAISITLLVLTCFFFLRACRKCSVMSALLSAGCFGYLVASWGGYSFLIVLIPLFVLVSLYLWGPNLNIYVTYSIFYATSTSLCLLTQYIEPKVFTSGEHILSHLVFALLQLIYVWKWASTNLPPSTIASLKRTLLISAFLGLAVVSSLMLSGKLALPPRVLSILDPTYANTHAPIVASVSEHQPTSWTTFFFDLHYLMFFTPIGLITALKKGDKSCIFICLWLLSTIYFSALMVRLVLVLAPAMCVLSAIGVSDILFKVSAWFNGETCIEVFFFKINVDPGKSEQEITEAEQEVSQDEAEESSENETIKEIKDQEIQSGNSDDEEIKEGTEPSDEANTENTIPEAKEKRSISLEGFLLILLIIFLLILKYMTHSTMVASEIYSSPTVVMSQRNYETGQKKIVDDFRQAYSFLRQNTPPDSRILSWWDYGYQIAGFSDRITLNDNNTWNFTHIALVGRTLTATEEEASHMMHKLDCDYVLLQFGGATGFAGDDVNKMPWIVRITGNHFPDVKESEYFPDGDNFVGDQITDKLKNSLLYKLAYYRFGELTTSQGPGFDLARRTSIAHTKYKLSHFEEVFTSDRWLVRIFRRKPLNSREAVRVFNPVVNRAVENDSGKRVFVSPFDDFFYLD